MGIDITIYLIKNDNKNDNFDYKILNSSNRSYKTSEQVYKKYEKSDIPIERDLFELYKDNFMPIDKMMVSLSALKKILKTYNIDNIFQIHEFIRNDFWPLFLLHEFKDGENDEDKIFLSMTP